MASITKREGKNGRLSYLVQIRVAGAKTVSKVFSDHALAVQFGDAKEREIRAAVERSHIPDPRKFYKERFIDVIDLFLKKDGITKKVRSNLAVIRRLVGSVSMGEIKTRWVKEYIALVKMRKTYRGTPYTDATIAVHLSAMAKVYKWRAEDYDLDLIKLPFSTEHLDAGWDVHRDRRLLVSEEASLISVMEKMKSAKEWKSLLSFALETGARQQEIIWATWSEVSFEKGYWLIPKSHTKTRKARAVPLTDKALEALHQMRGDKEPSPDSRIFDFLSTPSSACSAFRKIVRTAGIKDFRFHDLRHEAISRMVLHWTRMTVFEIMLIVGHSSTEMLNRYANLRPDELVSKFRRV